MIRQVLGLLRVEMIPVVQRLPAYSRLAYGLLREPALRARHKALLAGGVAYLVSPVDLIPGFIPVLGQIDDLAVALWALRRTLRAMPADVAATHLDRHGLTWEMLDGDLGRVGRSGRIMMRAGVALGQRFAAGAGRTLLRIGLGVLDRYRLPRRLTA
jgi:uncharacterized membrane protein YkvA (DUF1232 family)